MSDLSDRQIVYPGQSLGAGIICEGLVEKTKEDCISIVKGLLRKNQERYNVIPLNGAYKPKPGDVVVGVISHDFGSIYAVDMSGPYRGILKPRSDDRGRGRSGPRNYHRREEPTEFTVGQIISAKISNVDEVNEAQLVGPRILEGGYIIQVIPVRVPRIIGKKKSMIDVIRKYTGSRISVGQNGLIWIKEGNVPLAVEAIRTVEQKAFKGGLTDQITNYLKESSNL